MGQPYIGEIRMFAGNFAINGWAFCDGQYLPISENEALFNLIGTTYGGDGQSTFALPNLCGRIPVHMGAGPGLSTYQIGEMGGVEAVTLTTQQIPIHNHPALANDNGAGVRTSSPQNGVWANNGQAMYYNSGAAPTRAMRNNAVNPAGGSQPHDNMQPYLAVSFIISLYGIFPSQN